MAGYGRYVPSFHAVKDQICSTGSCWYLLANNAPSLQVTSCPVVLETSIYRSSSTHRQLSIRTLCSHSNHIQRPSLRLGAMPETATITLGRLLLSFVAISNSASPYIADFNYTHVYNPNWPPHARFHNGQTMSMGFVLGLTALYYAWRPVFSKTQYTKAMTKDSLFTATVIATLYWITGLSASLYPGCAWQDPEFLGTEIDYKTLGGPAQLTVFSVHGIVAWVAYALESSRLGKVKEA